MGEHKHLYKSDAEGQRRENQMVRNDTGERNRLDVHYIWMKCEACEPVDREKYKLLERAQLMDPNWLPKELRDRLEVQLDSVYNVPSSEGIAAQASGKR